MHSLIELWESVRDFIATGGDAKLIASETDMINKVDPHLTLEGLRLIWYKNQ